MTRSTAEPGGTLFLLRHEAGLTSGEVIHLCRGRHQFGPEPGSTWSGTPPVIAFEIDVNAEGPGEAVTLVPHGDANDSTVALMLDGDLVAEVTPVEPGQMIGIGSDAFLLERPDADQAPGFGPIDQSSATAVVVPPDAGLTQPSGLQLAVALAILLAALLLVAFGDLRYWPVLMPTSLLVGGAAWRQRRLDAGYVAGSRTLASQRCQGLRQRLVLSARDEARRRRGAAISSHHVLDAARHRRRLPGDLPVAIALGTAAWQPDLERDGPLDRPLLDVLRRYRSLPAVPVSIEPTETLLGIVGPRPACLAVARHVLSATLERDRPVRLVLSVHPDRDTLWSPSLAGRLRPEAADLPVVAIVDGAAPERRPKAGVMLADRVDDLAFEPDLLMTLHRDGVVGLSVPGTETTAEGLMPIGISKARFRELSFSTSPVTLTGHRGGSLQEARRHRARPVRGPVLVSVGSIFEELGTLTTIVLDVVRDQPGVQLVVLDGRDRGLAGLCELPRCTDYAATDAEARSILDELSMTRTGTPLLVVARDLGVRFGATSEGSDDSASRLESLVDRANDGRFLLVVADRPRFALPARVADGFPATVRSLDGGVLLTTPADRRWIARRRLSPGDVRLVARAFGQEQPARPRRPPVRTDPVQGGASETA